MKTINRLIIASFYTLIFFYMISCNKREKSPINIQNDKQQNFILNEHLLLSDYASYKSYYPEEGIIPTPEIAFQVGEIILKNFYGKDNIDEQKPFSINLDNNVWIIEGYLENGYSGGVAYIEISKITGEVLKITHTK